MRHRVRGRKLGRTASHRKAMFSNLVSSLIVHGRVKTTLPKAKELRSLADKLVTWAKQGDLHARRQARTYVRQKKALQRLFSELGVRFKDRNGGYTRVYHSGFRAGDAAPMALVEYLGEEAHLKAKKAKKTTKDSSKKVKKQEAKEAKKAQGQKKEAKKQTKFAAEEKKAVDSGAAQKKPMFRKSDKGTGRSGSSKKGVS